MMNGQLKTWTAYILCQPTVDIRDSYGEAGNWNYANADTIINPSTGRYSLRRGLRRNRGRGTLAAHLRSTWTGPMSTGRTCKKERKAMSCGAYTSRNGSTIYTLEAPLNR